MIKGEAYLMRAICYNTLVTRFASDYEPATAASAKGLPLVLGNGSSGQAVSFFIGRYL